MVIKWTNLHKVLTEYTEYFIKEAQKNIDDYDAVATGNMRNILPNEIKIGDDYFSITVKIEDYFKYVEGGSKGLISSPPNAVYPAHFPPVQAIKEWIEVKGLSTGNERDDLSFAYAISTNIEKRGLEPKPFFKDTKESTYKAFEEKIVQAIKDDVAQAIEDNIMPLFERIMRG